MTHEILVAVIILGLLAVALIVGLLWNGTPDQGETMEQLERQANKDHPYNKPIPSPFITRPDFSPKVSEEDKLKAAFRSYKCPDCKGSLEEFYGGPTGGMSINLCCANCWSAFNVAFVGGDVLMAERIPNHYWQGLGGFVAKGSDGKPYPEKLPIEGA